MEYKKYVRNMPKCLECGDVIRYGRTDKKFCCETCRTRHNNNLAREGRSFRRKVHSQLMKNYRLLDELFRMGTDCMEITDLVSLGFSPHIMTSFNKGRRYDEVGCFDIKYRMSPTRIYSISKIQNVSLPLQIDAEA